MYTDGGAHACMRIQYKCTRGPKRAYTKGSWSHFFGMSEGIKKQGCVVITSASVVESVRAGWVEGGPGNLSKPSTRQTTPLLYLLALKESTNKKRMCTQVHTLFRSYNLPTWSNQVLMFVLQTYQARNNGEVQTLWCKRLHTWPGVMNIPPSFNDRQMTTFLSGPSCLLKQSPVIHIRCLPT